MKTPKLTVNQKPALRNSFLRNISALSFGYWRHQYESSKHQWQMARLTNEEWDYLKGKYEGEINKLHFYAAVSAEINKNTKFPICAASGETLRRWCEVALSYQAADITYLEKILSFDHFRVARALAKLPANDAAGLSPIVILERAALDRWTVDEMRYHYGDLANDEDPINRVKSWLDNLARSQWDWVKSRQDRDEIGAHIIRLTEIINQNAEAK